MIFKYVLPAFAFIFLSLNPEEAWVSRVHNKVLGVHELSDQASLVLKVEKVSGPEDVVVVDQNGREVKLKYQAVKILEIIKDEAQGYTTSEIKIKSPPRSGLRVSGDKPVAIGQVISISDRKPLAAPVPEGKSYYEYKIENAAGPDDKVALFFGGYYDKNLSVYFGVMGAGLASLGQDSLLRKATALREYFDAVRNHNLEELKSAIVKHPGSINEVDETWGAPLHFAARYGNKEEIDLLIKSGASLLTRDSKGSGVLHNLVESQFMDNLPYVIKLSGDVNFKNSAGQTPLHIAVQGNAPVKLVQLLTQAGADPNIKNSDGQSALDLAKKLGSSEKLKALGFADSK